MKKYASILSKILVCKGITPRNRRPRSFFSAVRIAYETMCIKYINHFLNVLFRAYNLIIKRITRSAIIVEINTKDVKLVKTNFRLYIPKDIYKAKTINLVYLIKETQFLICFFFKEKIHLNASEIWLDYFSRSYYQATCS